MDPAIREDQLYSNNTSTKNNFNFNYAFTKVKYISLTTFLYDLNSRRYTLVSRILVNVSEEKDCYRAENSDLSIWSTGENVEEAIEALKKEVIELYEELKEIGKDNLGSEPAKWWLLLNNIIVENEVA